MEERRVRRDDHGAAAPEKGMAPPTYRLPPAIRLGPVRLQVADLARSEDFYGRLMGLERLRHDDRRASLRAPGGDEALIELVERPGARPMSPRGRIGLYHYALLVPNRPALARFALHAGRLGIRLGMSDHLVSEALYLSDPDGLGIEVYADRPRSTWQWQGSQLVMATEPLDLQNLIATAGTDTFDALPAGTVVGHVHLHVGRLEEAARFYHEALGLDKIVWNYPGALFLSAGGYHHHIGLNTWASHAAPAGPQDARLLAWTLMLPDAQSAQAAARSIESTGFTVSHEGTAWRAEDPWGTPMELRSAPASRT